MDNPTSRLPLDARTVARLLGGRAYGNRVSAPGPGHSRKDNSLSVLIEPAAPDGFVVHSFAGDDWRTVRDYVSDKLGIPRWSPPESNPSSLAWIETFARALNEERSRVEADKPFDDSSFLRQGYSRTAVYDYTEGGELLYQMLRYQHPTKGKELRPRHLGPCGRWLWGCGTERRVLYRAADLQGVAHNRVFVTEGEKDADRLASLGFLAVTVAFGKWSDEAVQALTGYECLILADKDQAGCEKAHKAAEALYGTAESIRIVHLPNLPERGDVSDWLDAGNDHNELLPIAMSMPLWRPNTEGENPGEAEPSEEQASASAPPPPRIAADPFYWTDPKSIPRREWVYGSHYIRRFVSVTVAPGGVGKSSLGIVEALAMTSGRNLLGVQPNGSSHVWLWNGEDPMDELKRRVMAAVKHYSLDKADFEGRLFVNSGRTTEIILAVQGSKGLTIAEPVVQDLIRTIQENAIDVVIIDPFVSSHQVSENDNTAIDRVVKLWAKIAEVTGCAVELVHHVRKTGGNEVTVEDGRGAVALLAAARSARVLNRMSETEAASAGVEKRGTYFRIDNGKANLAPPPERTQWCRLESVDLENGTTIVDLNDGGVPLTLGGGDHVGVVTEWEWPNPLDQVTVADLRAVQDEVAKGRWRQDVQARDWVGRAVAKVLRLDPENKAHRSKIKGLLKIWITNGMFEVLTEKDDKGNDRPYVKVGQRAND